MKKIISIILSAALAMSAMCVFADDEITVTLDGEKLLFDQSPIVMDERVLVPMRAIFEALGCNVDYASYDGTTYVYAYNNFKNITLEIGKNEISINGETKEIDVPAMILNNRTLVPIRAISEGMDATVDWDGETKTVIIESKQGQHKITPQTISYSINSEDGKELVKISATYPVIENAEKDEYIDQINADFKQSAYDYIESKKEEWKEYAEFPTDSATLPWESTISYQVNTDRNDILSISVMDYWYFGGAHPSTTLVAHNYDLKNKKSLVLSDVLKGDLKKVTTDSFEDYVKTYDSEYAEELRKEIANAAENVKFYICDDSVVLYFDVYEVAPYAAGYPAVEIFYDADLFNIDLSDANLEEFEINVDGNPTTGYTWEVVSENSDKVEITREFKESQSSLGENVGLVGVGGVYTFNIKGKKPGKCTFSIAYMRTWEGEKSIESKYTYDLYINAQGNITVLNAKSE